MQRAKEKTNKTENRMTHKLSLNDDYFFSSFNRLDTYAGFCFLSILFRMLELQPNRLSRCDQFMLIFGEFRWAQHGIYTTSGNIILYCLCLELSEWSEKWERERNQTTKYQEKPTKKRREKKNKRNEMKWTKDNDNDIQTHTRSFILVDLFLSREVFGYVCSFQSNSLVD